MRYKIAITVTALVFVALFFYVRWELGTAERLIKEQQECIDHIITPKELQMQLIANGYDCGTDGADGFICGPNSMAAWNLAVNDQYYELTVSMMPKGNK